LPTTLKSTQHKIHIQINFQLLISAFFWVEAFCYLKKRRVSTQKNADFTMLIYPMGFQFCPRYPESLGPVLLRISDKSQTWYGLKLQKYTGKKYLTYIIGK